MQSDVGLYPCFGVSVIYFLLASQSYVQFLKQKKVTDHNRQVPALLDHLAISSMVLAYLQYRHPLLSLPFPCQVAVIYLRQI